MTAEEFERLSAWQAELWIARRFHDLAAAGYPPSQALLMAVRPELDVDAAVAARPVPSATRAV